MLFFKQSKSLACDNVFHVFVCQTKLCSRAFTIIKRKIFGVLLKIILRLAKLIDKRVACVAYIINRTALLGRKIFVNAARQTVCNRKFRVS